MDDRDRAAPIALARNAPVAQLVIDLPLRLRPVAERRASSRRATSSFAASIVMPSRKRELIITPSPS